MLQLILGSMFGGKTTELIRRLTRASIAGKHVVILRPNTDNRSHLTHSQLTHKLEEKFVDSISEINWEEYDVIGVDEGQFFNSNFVDDVNKIADSGRKVIIAGLNGTSERKPFENIQALIPHVDDIIFMPAVCTNCGSEHGVYSFYKLGEKTQAVKVGGEEAYTALCRACYNEKSNI
jgi:thymidine kinase